MNPLDKIKEMFSKEEEEQTPEELEQFFTRNRNKKVMARTTLPTPEELKQKEAEEGV